MEKLANSGFVDAQLALGQHDQNSDKYRTNEDATNWLKQAAESGYVIAQWYYAQQLSDNADTEDSGDNAITWHFMAAEQGYAPSQYTLAYALETNQGVQSNNIESCKWYTLGLRRYDNKSEQQKFFAGLDRLHLTENQKAQCNTLAQTWEKTHTYAYQNVKDVPDFYNYAWEQCEQGIAKHTIFTDPSHDIDDLIGRSEQFIESKFGSSKSKIIRLNEVEPASQRRHIGGILSKSKREHQQIKENRQFYKDCIQSYWYSKSDEDWALIDVLFWHPVSIN
ncbi:tetratricopeptide repeat protein [Oleiphilus messinensis]|uniref:tetratricopeptide repeat protein n=1 Tax=Oleiphilus messinensis TaxID=141451 RepID=UPI0012FAAB21|nr:hypothetical protein [Oleiphilus messinensis]